MLITARQFRHNKIKYLVVMLLYTLLAFGFGYFVHRSGFTFGDLYRSLERDTSFIPKRVQAMLARPDIDRITIDIKHEDFMRLAYQREIALNAGILISSSEDFVPASIGYGDQSVNVELRLKGDFADHLDTDKWSFRIRVKGDNTLFGMKQFSIQHPQTRNYIYEWIYHQALTREGVIALRYQFINVTLNGKDLGIYALEEHFEKRLVEYNQLREGPIVRFNENIRWQQRFPYPNSDPNGDSSFLAADIDTFQTSQMLSDPSSYAQHIQAIHLLESFRRGELETSDVFDIQRLARFFAINDLIGGQHSTFWGNLRFYYNPITSRLEPIGFDADSGRPIKALSMGRGPDAGPMLFEEIFNDPLFFQEYVKTLERISEPDYLNTLLAELDDELENNLNVVYSEFPDFSYSEDVFYQNQRFIEAQLNPTKGLHAYYHESSGEQIELELGNIQPMPVEVLSVSYQDSILFQPVQPIVLPETPAVQSEPVDFRIVRFTLPEDFVWSKTIIQDLKVNYRLVATSRMRQEAVFPWSYLAESFVDDDFIRQEPNVHKFDFLVVDDSRREIFIKPGAWQLAQSLIIPKGYRIIAGEGTQLNLSSLAKILSYSPLEFIGSEDDPIVIQSTDSTGQGIVVMNADQVSRLEHVIFQNLANPSQGGWELTGAVTFYESPVHILHSRFVGARAEDALNIVRSEFTIDRTLFGETSSDAFDADFAKGKITNSSFFKAGNDAIDASGSVIDIDIVRVDGAGDKGLSVGERSQVTVNDMGISGSRIGVASKDLSQIIIRNINISDSEIGLTAYQKKPEFGSSAMEVRDLGMAAVTTFYLVEVNSRLVVDTRLIEANYEKVYEMLYGEEQ
jgi:hypothetical protein